MAGMFNEPGGLETFLAARKGLMDEAAHQAQVDSQAQFLKDRAALGTNPTADQLQTLGERYINDPKSLVDMINKKKELIPLGTGGLYRPATGESIPPFATAPAEKPPLIQMLPVPGNKEQPHISRDNGVTWNPIPGSSARDVFAPQAGSTKNTFLQDSNTGKKYSLDNNGNAYEAQPNGAWKSIPFDGIPSSAVRLGSGGGQLGNRESVFINRVILSGNEAARDLENVTKLPLSASRGIFGGRGQGEGLFNAGKETLANAMTTQEVQSYNVFATGFQRSLAAIEAAGLAPSGTLSHQMDAVIAKEGDSNFTKLQKLAQIRQIVDAGLETISANPRVPDATKKHIEGITSKIEKAVPFTQSDLLDFQQQLQANPGLNLKTFLASKKAAPQGGAIKFLGFE